MADGIELEWDETPADMNSAGTPAEKTVVPEPTPVKQVAPQAPKKEYPEDDKDRDGYVPQKRFNAVWGRTKDLERELNQKEEQLRVIREQNEQILAFQKESAVKQIDAELQEAYSIGDSITASKLLARHTELTQPKLNTQPQYQPQQNYVDPNAQIAIAVFESQNPWASATGGDAIASLVLQKNVAEVASDPQYQGNYTAILNEAKARTMKDVPDRFAKASPAPSMVGAPSSPGVSNTPAKKTIRLSRQEMNAADEMLTSIKDPMARYKYYAQFTYGGK